jgi:hypothetical protein
MGFTVPLILTQYYVFHSAQWARALNLHFLGAFAITELLKRDVVRVFLMMEMYV